MRELMDDLIVRVAFVVKEGGARKFLGKNNTLLFVVFIRSAFFRLLRVLRTSQDTPRETADSKYWASRTPRGNRTTILQG